MKTYIALLRGINVGGNNKIKMEDLRQYCEELGWKNVQTYIQSGNIIFQSDEIDISILSNQLAAFLKEKMGKTIPVLVIRRTELQEIYDHNPFIIEKKMSTDLLYLTILKDKVDQEQVSMISPDQFRPDEFIIRGRAIYLMLPNGVADSKLTIPLFEKTFNTLATSRNWKTVGKLIEMGTFGVQNAKTNN
jgi:uncharacterized protein (DUF1697 family)